MTKDTTERAHASLVGEVRADGWNSDMSAAPRDGTRIIAAHIGWCYSSSALHAERLPEEKDEWRVFWVSSAEYDPCKDRWTDGLEALMPPTHWMPLNTPVPDRGPQGCDTPPSGWYCTRKSGHDGPCAAVEDVSVFALPSPQEKN